MRRARAAVSSLLLSLLLLLATLSVATADFSLEGWHYAKSITLPTEVGADGLVQVAPDREVFAGAVPGLADLRIIQGADQEVPYKLELVTGQEQRTPFSVTLLIRDYAPGQYSTLVADLGPQGILHNEVELAVRSRNLRRAATVETSDDAVSWRQVAQQEIYDFSIEQRRFSVTNTRIRYPESRARYLRVRVAETEGAPLDVAGVSVSLVSESLARYSSYPATIVAREEETRSLSTLLTLDVGIEGLPHSRMELTVPEVNFYREVSVEASSDGEVWTPLQAGRAIYAYDTQRFTGKDLKVEYPESFRRYLRLTIHNEDSPPLTVSAIKASTPVRRVVFVAQAGASYQLFYGGAKARVPSYDIERFFPFLASEELPQARLGPQTINPLFQPPQSPLTERLPWLLPTAFSVAAALLLLLVVGFVRRASRLLPPPPAHS